MEKFTCAFCGAEQTPDGKILKDGKKAAPPEVKQKAKPRGKPFQKREQAPTQRKEEETSMWD